MEVSVIIPTYKPEYYINECIYSLMHQNISKDAFEIIIVLNGCCEPYFSYLNKLLGDKCKTNVRIIQTDIPGVSNERNIGLDNALGKYVLFIDDDDWVSENYLSNLLSVASEDAIACSNVALINPENDEQIPYFLSSAYNKCSKYGKFTLFNCRSFLSTVCCKLIPMSIIGKRRFDVKYKLGEDSLYMFCVSDKIKRIALSSNNTIYHVRARQNSASRKHYSFYLRLRVALSLTASYVWIYIKAPFSYDFFLFASRVFATIFKLRKKEYV